MKCYNLVLICLFALIFSSALAYKKNRVRVEKAQNSAMMKTLLEVTNKILAKVKFTEYTMEQKKQLYKILFEHLFIEGEDKKCQKAMLDTVDKVTNLIYPHHFEYFVKTQDLEVDIIFRIKHFISNQSDVEFKKCGEAIINKGSDQYNKAVKAMEKEMDTINRGYLPNPGVAHELITSIISVHRNLATKTLYQRLNHADE
jgi:hypothetical protein